MEHVRKKRRTRRWAGIAALGIVLTSVAAAPASPGSSFPVGDFEQQLDGFTGKRGTEVALSRDGAGRQDSRAMRVRTTTVSRGAVVRSSRRFTDDHPRGAKYVATAWVRATGDARVTLQIRELADGKLLNTERSPRTTVSDDGWTRVRASIRATERDSRFGLRFRTPPLDGERLFVDDVRIRQVDTSGDGGQLTNGCRYSARGIPSCGVYVGAAHGSNSDPSALEQELGQHLGVRRTYYTASGVDSAVETAREDVAAGRIPWISFKLPYSWADMADGRGDAWARNLTERLSRVDGPVWVAFHHEPEGDGNLGDWRRMQEHLAPIVRQGAPNVAFSVVLMGYHEFYGAPEYDLGRIWPRGVKIDIAGFDIYQQYGVVKDGEKNTDWTPFADYFRKIRAWAGSENVAWALGETGITDEAQQERRDEIPNTVKLMKEYGGIAYAYFDTTLNSIAPWDLSPAQKQAAFGRALVGSPAIAP